MRRGPLERLLSGRLRPARARGLPRVDAPSLQPEAGAIIAPHPAFKGQATATLSPVADTLARLPDLLGPPVTPRHITDPTILVFDSGLGGLTVFREVAKARPDARFVYLADDQMFPYGRLSEPDLIARVETVMADTLPAVKPDLVVIACNTASTVVLGTLRRRFAVPFVGTVPAVKPACAASETRRITVLATPGTIGRDYTRALIETYAGDCQVDLVGSTRLAAYAEAEMRGEAVGDARIAAELDPCFRDDTAGRTDTVVLACTHYPLLVERFRMLSPWPVRFVDPAPAIARRVTDLIGPVASGPLDGSIGDARFTSGKPAGETLARVLAAFGLATG
jgi:glutamate racemase